MGLVIRESWIVIVGMIEDLVITGGSGFIGAPGVPLVSEMTGDAGLVIVAGLFAEAGVFTTVGLGKKQLLSEKSGLDFEYS